MANSKSQELQVADDPPFQAAIWRVQRVAWLLFAAILVAAALGFTGAGGPFARVRLATAHGVIDHPRVMRWNTPDRIEIATTGRPASVALGPRFLDLFEVRGITPTPERSELNAGGVRHHFAAAEGADGNGTIILHVQPSHPTLGAAVEIALGAGDPVPLNVVVLP